VEWVVLSGLRWWFVEVAWFLFELDNLIIGSSNLLSGLGLDQ
jgi:hypothetical protein